MEILSGENLSHRLQAILKLCRHLHISFLAIRAVIGGGISKRTCTTLASSHLYPHSQYNGPGFLSGQHVRGPPIVTFRPPHCDRTLFAQVRCSFHKCGRCCTVSRTIRLTLPRSNPRVYSHRLYGGSYEGSRCPIR